MRREKQCITARNEMTLRVGCEDRSSASLKKRDGSRTKSTPFEMRVGELYRCGGEVVEHKSYTANKTVLNDRSLMRSVIGL